MKRSTCGATPHLFGGRSCELPKGHRANAKGRVQHRYRSGSVVWFDVTREDGRGAREPEPPDFNQAAFRIVQQATREKPARRQTRKRPARA